LIIERNKCIITAMPVILLRLPKIQTTPLERARQCPYCNSEILQRWGRETRSVYDQKERLTEVHRYRCSRCGRTFRSYHPDIGRTSRTQRIRTLAALGWALGLSYRDVSLFLKKYGINISHTTVWRDRQKLWERAKKKVVTGPLERYALDDDFKLNFSPRLGIVVAVEWADGSREILGTVDEFNPRRIKKWLESMVDDINIVIQHVETGYLYQP
jgi:DNA-directed RNA polymerase subunit RPC12/RpoP